MGLLELFVAATIPVLKVLLITGLGTYLALDRVNILGVEARKHVNSLVFYVYTPALVASNLAKTITYDSMIKLWFMPFNILITFIIGSILGWIVIAFTRPPPHLRGLILGCCAAGNLGNMLFVIIPAICKEKGSPFGSPDTCHSLGMAYSSLSMAIGAIYLWSYVYNIVRMSTTRRIEESRTDYSSNGKSLRGTSTSELESCTEPLLPSEHVHHQYILPCATSDPKAEVSVSNKIKQQLRMVCGNINWKLLFAPSTIAVIVGFVVGLIPPIHKLLIGDAALLRVIQNSASFLGDAAIPTITLIVGGNLLKGLKGPGIQKSLILSIVVARYVALPVTGILVVKGAIRFGLVQADPLYQFILLLQFALPPAMNIGTITQLFGEGESECSVIMLWTYALASISLTLWSAFFMWLVA